MHIYMYIYVSRYVYVYVHVRTYIHAARACSVKCSENDSNSENDLVWLQLRFQITTYMRSNATL
jgi:hypothetical protein